MILWCIVHAIAWMYETPIEGIATNFCIIFSIFETIAEIIALHNIIKDVWLTYQCRKMEKKRK